MASSSRARPPTPAPPASWALVYRTGGRRLAWLVIEGVPAGTPRAEVAEALEGASAGRRWAPGVVIGAALVAESRWGNLEGLERAERVTWAELTPAEVRLGLRVPGPVHAQLVRAALRRGQPLQRWCLERLLEAATAELAPPPPSALPPAPARAARAKRKAPAPAPPAQPSTPAGDGPPSSPARRSRASADPSPPRPRSPRRTPSRGEPTPSP